MRYASSNFWAATLAATLALAACNGSSHHSGAVGDTPPPGGKVGHVFIVVLENENADVSFGPASPAPYLAMTLPAMGAFLPEYYGTGHLSLGNYISMVSGQGFNPATQSDCQIFQDFIGLPALALDGQAVGQGCVYPDFVPTVANQLQDAGLEWKGYMEDMGNDPERDGGATCAHPAVNSQDPTQSADAADNYAVRHNPFMYFHSIIDDQANCDARVVPLTALEADLASLATTPEYVFITPSLCHDGHDEPCVNGEPGGLVSADEFLRTWVPKIMASAAFQKDGLLIVTFDEAEANPEEPDGSDASACCGELPGYNTPLPGIFGLGGGRVGAVLVSPLIRPGTVSEVPYNHYSLLKSVEDIFGLPYLGYAGQAALVSFGPDIFGP
ncbi:MAG TPA: alkaline phosphatase family protein [Solimonas sp.]|nr:alkaline phosphatase family protein [Solimonas sp.]